MKSFHTTAVFLGFSLKKEQASQILPADYYPPAQKGDIYRIIATGVEKIILIDGFFCSTRPVWQRELLDALDEGIEVWGGSGIGALRAVELQDFGMKGCGTIFEWYRDGIIDGDDEVAVRYGLESDDFCRFSEPLVNIRYTLLNAVQDKCLTLEQAENLLEYAKNLYYPNRSYERLLKSPIFSNLSQSELARIEDYFFSKNIDLQKLDTIQILTKQANLQNHLKSQFPNSATFLPPTLEIQTKRLAMTGFICSENIVIGDKVWQAVSKNSELLNAMYPTLSKQSFVLQWAKQNHVSFPPNKLEEYIAEWEKQHNIVVTKKWLQSNGLTGANYQALLKESCLIDWITKQGPNYFGFKWEFETALESECLIAGKDTFDFNSIALSLASFQDEGNSELKQLWYKLSQRRFILEWSHQNGIAYPQEVLDSYIEQWEKQKAIVDRDAWLKKNNISPSYYRELLGEKAWLEWMVKQGINYFGIAWNFPLALIRELQITGKAAPIIKDYYGTTY